MSPELATHAWQFERLADTPADLAMLPDRLLEDSRARCH